METGGATPKTRETAAWLGANQDAALQVLEKRRRSSTKHSPRLAGNFVNLTWETAAATTASGSRR